MTRSSSTLGLLLSLPVTVFSGSCNYAENGPFGIFVVDECGAQFESNVYFFGECNNGPTGFPEFGTYQDDQCVTGLVPPGTGGGRCDNADTGCRLYSLDIIRYPASTDCGVTGNNFEIPLSAIITDGAEGQCMEIPNDSRFSSFQISSTIDINGYGFDSYDSTDCSGTVTNQYSYYSGCNLAPGGGSVYVTVELVDDGREPYKTGVQTTCSETIEVTSFDFANPLTCDPLGDNFPCDDMLGIYYFTGYDQQGTPTYTKPSTGGVFSVQIEQINPPAATEGDYLAATAFTIDGYYFSPGWDHFSDVYIVDQCTDTDLFKVEFGALDGTTNIQYYFDSTQSTNSGTSFSPLYITAILDDCIGVGFDNDDEPTPSPTDKPTVGGVTCPNYDFTVYSNCDDDTNCANCQPWGCANCASGYYKMGNLMRCQSCTDNYPGCSQCNDWNGCTTCSSGFTLGYEGSCSDEICQ